MSGPEASEGSLGFASGLSAGEDSRSAAASAAEQAQEKLGGPCDLAILAMTPAHAGRADAVIEEITRRLEPGTLIGTTAEGVIAGATEQQQGAGIALLAGRLPGARMHSFTDRDLRVVAGDDEAGHAEIGEAIGGGPELRAVILLADPFSVPVANLLPTLDAGILQVGGSPAHAPVVGGVASGGRAPGEHVMISGTAPRRHGLVGVSISGDLRTDAVVSQGCRPIGPNLLVTRAKRNIVMELAGRPALDAIRDVARASDDRTRELLTHGVLLGRVVDEYKDHFGRGDYLIRNVVRADERSGTIVINDSLRVGQSVRVHVRDAETASEDLALLLDGQKLHGAPAGALLVTCNGRGTRLFDEPHHDAETVQRAFGLPQPGDERAKSGRAIEAGRAAVPLAGFFASGEIGPIAGRTYLHGHTVCALLFRGR